MRQKLIGIFVTILVCIGFYFYFSGNKKPFSRDTSVYKAIPVSSPVFFEFSSINELAGNGKLKKELVNIGIGKEWLDFVNKANSVIDNNDEIDNDCIRGSFILAYHVTGRKTLMPVIIKKMGSKEQFGDVQKLFKLLYPEKKYKYREREYSKKRIIEIVGPDGDGLCYTFVEGLLVVSYKSISVEKVIRQIFSEGVLDNDYFIKVNKTAERQGISLYVNHSRLNGVLANIFDDSVIKREDEFGNNVSYRPLSWATKFKDFASFSELDLKLYTEAIFLHGISMADDSLNNYLAIFEDQQAIRYNTDEVLPYNTSFFCSFSFSDKKSFFNKLENYFSHSNVYYKREERLKKFNSGIRSNIREIFQKLLKNEVAIAMTTIPVKAEDRDTYFLMHTEGGSIAKEELKKLIHNYANKKKLNEDELKYTYTIDDDIKFDIYKFPYYSLPEVWLGAPFSFVQAKFVTVYDNYIVFCNSQKGLKEYLRSVVLGNILKDEINYQEFLQNCSNRANINLFIDINKAYGMNKGLFSEELLELMRSKEKNIRKFNMINWQVQRDKEIYFNSICVNYKPEIKQYAPTTWQSNIEGNINWKPQIVENHKNNNEKEIIFQDTKNYLYLLTNMGRIEWKIGLPSKIISKIYQIDYYKNGNLQFLFNTKEKLYLIDRNGNHVADFPISLKSNATNGVALFDYDNNKNYRYFVAGEDRKIYAYDYSGKIIKGWKFKNSDHIVTSPVQHYRVKGKDYIVFKDESRIYIQNRQGFTRVKTDARFTNSSNPVILNLDGKPKMVATNNRGKVYYIYFDGSYEVKGTGKFSKKHYFTVDDLDGDRILEFVFIDGNEITVMKENGKKIFHKKINNTISNPPHIYSFGGNRKEIGIVDDLKGQIYLFNQKGELHKGFPLIGNSQFSIGKLNKNSKDFNLIVGGEGAKILNYTID